jgi:glycosyltransferase involved in cell wall biosynthesis
LKNSTFFVVPFDAFLPKIIKHNQYLGVYNPYGVYLLKRKLTKIKPDLVHSNHLPAGKYGTKAASLCNIPNIVTMRCMYPKKAFYYNRFVDQRVVKYADRVVFNSLRGAELLRERTNSTNIISILNGINLTRFTSNNNDKAIYQNCGIPQDKKIFLLPARIYPDKGHHILIKSLKGLISKYPDIHVVFLGDEDMNFKGIKKEFHSLAVTLGVDSYITWINFSENIVPFFKNAYCVVLPSFSEGCPRVLLEALAAGVPIIGSKIDGINEILEEGINGYGFISKNCESLSHAIEKIMSLGLERYIKMKNHCALTAKSNYDISKMILSYQNLYLELINNR